MFILRRSDTQVAAILSQEEERQRSCINLIAAENYASKAVLEAQGSLLTNKYAEGYPQSRYYGGCQAVDLAESLAIQRAEELFHAQHANVQPHSGAQANMAAYFSLLEPGEAIMGLGLSHGGHLTHGSAVNFSGRLYRFIPYGVNPETERFDYEELLQLAVGNKPQLIIAGASSYPRIIEFERFRQIADAVGAKLMVDMAHLAGLVAAGLHPSPVPYAEVVTSTSHKTLRGPRGGFILCQAGQASRIDSAVFPGIQGGPLMHVIAAKAVAFAEAMQPEFISYQKAVLENARVLAAELQRLGVRVVSGGTDNHLILVDLTQQGITGKEAEQALETAGINVNRNVIPFENLSPQVASGIRLGTPAVTTRGFGPEEMKAIASLIVKVLAHPGEEGICREVRRETEEICSRFSLPGVEC